MNREDTPAVQWMLGYHEAHHSTTNRRSLPTPGSPGRAATAHPNAHTLGGLRRSATPANHGRPIRHTESGSRAASATHGHCCLSDQQPGHLSRWACGYPHNHCEPGSDIRSHRLLHSRSRLDGPDQQRLQHDAHGIQRDHPRRPDLVGHPNIVIRFY